jgi:LAS superfamily LD-carboxypeptidase LdcB
MFNELELTGRARTHVVQREDVPAAIHARAWEPFLELKAAAARDGIEVEIASGFRDFSAQLRIWNMKYRGERPLYDDAGNVREHASLDPGALIEGILCWSALPGASRHHWGTDIDLVDRAAMPEQYRYRLVPQEYAEGGVFHRLNAWLDENLSRFDFFRPYASYQGGVYPEPWHVSYAPLSSVALQMLTPDLIAATLADADVLGKDHVLSRLADIYRGYIANISGVNRPPAVV